MRSLSFLHAVWWLRPQTARDVACLAAATALLAGALLPVDLIASLMVEGGPVESTTVAFYFVAAALMALLRPPSVTVQTATMLTILLAAFGARELDLHKALTGTSVLRVSFYSGDAPLLHKTMSLLLLAPVVVALVGLARRVGPLLRCARMQQPAALTVVAFAITMVLTKAADRSVNILIEDFSLGVTPRVSAAVLAVEELLEMCLPLLACLGWVQAYAALPGSPHVDESLSLGE